RLPIPVITRYSTCSLSSGIIQNVHCCVHSVECERCDFSSLGQGNSVLSSISVSDSASVSLYLWSDIRIITTTGCVLTIHSNQPHIGLYSTMSSSASQICGVFLSHSLHLKKMFRTLIFFCLWHLVDGVKRVYTIEGDSVTLNTDVRDIDRNMHYIVWGFGPECTGIAEWFTEVTYHLDQKFGGRLRMDRQTGSLTIRNVRTTDSGLYQRDIIYYNPFLQETVLFNVTVYDAVKTVLLTEGDSVTLHTNVTDIHRQDIRYIQWRIEPENTLLDIIFDNGTSDIRYYHDEIFRNRLQMDTQTGSLTIRNIRTTDSGLFSAHTCHYQRLYTMSLSILIIRIISVQMFTAVFSVESYSLSLTLEVEYQEKNTYSCKVNNPISDQSTHLNITEHCQPCPDSVHCCGFTEAVIRLVLSGVVGVATVIMVVYDIRFRRAEKKRRTQSQSVVE
ncbi:hypothetical protein cypCar_00032860, partial [Cyprinus carpio]